MAATDWSRVDAIVRQVLAACDGIAHAREFDRAGLTRRQLAAVFRRGVVERPRIGWYVDPALSWQVKRAVRVGGVACCATAVELYGLPIPPGVRRLHVLVEEHRGEVRHNRDRSHVLVSVADDPEVGLHRGALLDRPHRGVVSLTDALLQLARCVPSDWWIAAVDAALHRPREGAPLLDDAGLEELRGVLPRRVGRRLRLVDGSSESCIETLLRLGMQRRGLDFSTQVVLAPGIRVDFLVGRLVIEADGSAFHDAERDAERDAILRALGYEVLRLPYDVIVHDLEGAVDAVERALAASR